MFLFVFDRVENIAGKGENADQHFFFSHIFKRPHFESRDFVAMSWTYFTWDGWEQYYCKCIYNV